MPIFTTQDSSVKTEESSPMSSQVEETASESNAVEGIVLYTDGSCKPSSNGFTGWGMHGYTYSYLSKGENMVMDNYSTDQGYLKKDELHHRFNNQVSKPVKPIEYVDYMGSSLDIGTNNRAELTALIEALLFVKEKAIKRVTVRMDSELTKKGITQWCAGWEKNGWKTATGEPVQNQDLWKRANELYKALKLEDYKISVHWVKGHKDHKGNVEADALAGIAANYSLNGVLKEIREISPAKGYWKNETERHPFLSLKRVYFNSVPEHNTPGVYFHADPGAADHLIGKRIPETGLAVIRLHEPDFLIEEIRHRQYEVSKEISTIVMLKMDRVYDRAIYPYIKTHGRYALNPSKKNLNLNWFDRKPVCVEVGATGLSMRAVECFNLLEEKLNTYINMVSFNDSAENKSNHLTIHDVTPSFFEYTESQNKHGSVRKCTLKPTFVVGFQDMSIDIEEEHEGSSKKMKIPLILGTDLLPRNNLKKLESLNPRVSLITWREGAKSLRYATIIQCDQGVGIWSNFFADRVFFR